MGNRENSLGGSGESGRQLKSLSGSSWDGASGNFLSLGVLSHWKLHFQCDTSIFTLCRWNQAMRYDLHICFLFQNRTKSCQRFCSNVDNFESQSAFAGVFCLFPGLKRQQLFSLKIILQKQKFSYWQQSLKKYKSSNFERLSLKIVKEAAK